MVRFTFIAVTLLTAQAITSQAWAKGKERAGDHSAMIVAVIAPASVEYNGKTRKLAVGDAVIDGDVLVTGEGGKIKALLADDSVLNLGGKTRFQIGKVAVKEGKREVSLKILSGKFMAAVSQWFGSSNSWQVETPTAVAGVRGTVLWGDTALDAICALHGVVEVSSLSGGDSTKVKLEAGKCAAKMGQGKTDPLAPTADEVQKYLADVTIPR